MGGRCQTDGEQNTVLIETEEHNRLTRQQEGILLHKRTANFGLFGVRIKGGRTAEYWTG